MTELEELSKIIEDALHNHPDLVTKMVMALNEKKLSITEGCALLIGCAASGAKLTKIPKESFLLLCEVIFEYINVDKLVVVPQTKTDGTLN